MADLRIGTCSWKFGSWRGLVYSASSGINFPQEHARLYRTVEIDRWKDVIKSFPAVVIRLHGPNRQRIEKKAGGDGIRRLMVEE